MIVTRMFTGDDGKSHFEDVDLEDQNIVSPEGKIWTKDGSIGYRPNEPGVADWHNPGVGRPGAPKRLLNVILAGELTIEVANGERRAFGPGSVILGEDATGEGHRSWGKDCTTFVITLE